MVGYLTLLENSGLCVGLGIPLARRCSSFFLKHSVTRSRISSTCDWFGVLATNWFVVSISCGARDLDEGEFTISVSKCSSPLWSTYIPLVSKASTFWLLSSNGSPFSDVEMWLS